MKTIEIKVFDIINKKQAITYDAGYLLREKIVELSQANKNEEEIDIVLDFENIHLFVSGFFSVSIGWFRLPDSGFVLGTKINLKSKNLNDLGQDLMDHVIEIAEEKAKNPNYMQEIIDKAMEEIDEKQNNKEPPDEDNLET